MGSTAFELRTFPGFDHFHLAAAQLGRFPLLEGEPLSISLPVYVSHMSFGALSREAKIALARGSRLAGTLICSGEGGMLPEEREEAALYVLEMASGYFGFRDENIAIADAVEIKIGQSAKPGFGGELPAAKVTEEIAVVRGLEPAQAAVSPARFPDIRSLEQLSERIASLRARFPGKPVGVKIAANDIAKDIEPALSLEPDFITVDGFGGGTGAAPLHVRDHFGAPLVKALPVARRFVDRHNGTRPSRPASLVATGGLRTPSDVMKAIALGADACALATASLIALGCEYYRACETGNCPVGITTHDPRLRERLDVEKGANRVARFFTGMRSILEDYLGAMGRSSPLEVGPEDLVPLTREAEAILRGNSIP
jgi:glutamate synthase domain-containing protein 2